ncbi:MAG: YicC family protein [Firmicutes bacterium]|nr:YicC family protein [Bacillota bacterium]HAL63130.1 YicC family protein [Clostridiales bacterium]
MLKSMTGYGRKEEIADGKRILCEIKSVNHRYADYNIKVPRHYGFLEERVRNLVSGYIKRGKVDIYIAVEDFSESDKVITVNYDLAKNYYDALCDLRDKFGLKDDITTMGLSRYPDIFVATQKEEDEESVWETVKKVLIPTIESFVSMREREGERIEKDLKDRIEYMKILAQRIEKRSPLTVKEYSDKLYEKIKEVLSEKDVDDARVLTEVAVFADKVAVNEELVRLSSHFEEFYQIISVPEPAGRKLDFLIQEINREINTTGSKALDIEIAKTVVELKAETEKLREQIQNIE